MVTAFTAEGRIVVEFWRRGLGGLMVAQEERGAAARLGWWSPIADAGMGVLGFLEFGPGPPRATF